MGLHRADMGLSALLVLLCWGSVRGTCDVCGVRYDHIKDYSTPFEQHATFPTCAYYQDAACCTAETVDACGPPSSACCHGWVVIALKCRGRRLESG